MKLYTTLEHWYEDYETYGDTVTGVYSTKAMAISTNPDMIAVVELDTIIPPRVIYPTHGEWNLK